MPATAINSSSDFTKFYTSFKKFLLVTSKLPRDAVNTKLYYINRESIWFTHHAEPSLIKTQLGQFVKVNKINKKGKLSTTRRLITVQGTAIPAPLLALIINSRLGQAGEKGLSGPAMLKAMTKLLSNRLRSVNFIRVGFIASVRILEPLVNERKGLPPSDGSVRQIGRPKGDAKPAGTGWKVEGMTVNNANARRDTHDSLMNWGARGQQKAFDYEAGRIDEYLEMKLNPPVKQFNEENK